MKRFGAGSVWAVVAAAGESLRMGLPDGESKQFLLLGGEPILSHSVRRLLEMSEVAGVVVVLHPSHSVRFAGALQLFDQSKPVLLAEGGRETGRLCAGRLDASAGGGARHRRARRRPAALQPSRLRRLLGRAYPCRRRRARLCRFGHAQACR